MAKYITPDNARKGISILHRLNAVPKGKIEVLAVELDHIVRRTCPENAEQYYEILVGKTDEEKATIKENYIQPKINSYLHAQINNLGYFLSLPQCYPGDKLILRACSKRIHFDYSETYQEHFTLCLIYLNKELGDIEKILNQERIENFTNSNTFRAFLDEVILRLQEFGQNGLVLERVKAFKKRRNFSFTETNIKLHEAYGGRPKSFLLKAYHSDKNHFKLNGARDLRLLKELKKENLIDSSTKVEQLRRIFKNQYIKHQQKINWTGSFYLLNRFVTILHYEHEAIFSTGRNIWTTTSNCFLVRGRQIKTSSLSNASPSNPEKVKALENILSFYFFISEH